MSKGSKEERQGVVDSLTEEELLFRLAEIAKVTTNNSSQANTSSPAVSLKDSQRFYLSQKIAGSNKRCVQCGRALVNDEAHAAALLGTKTQLKDYLRIMGGDKK